MKSKACVFPLFLFLCFISVNSHASVATFLGKVAIYSGKVVGKAALTSFGKHLGEKAADKTLNLLASKYSPENKQATLVDGSQLVYEKVDSNTYNAFLYPKQTSINWNSLFTQEYNTMNSQQLASFNISMQFLNSLMQAQAAEFAQQQKAVEMMLPMLSQLLQMEMQTPQADVRALTNILNSLSSVSTQQFNDPGLIQHTPQEWYFKGVGLWSENAHEYINPQLAIEYFNNAIKLDPNNPNTYSSRGIAYNQIGAYTAAVGDFSRAINLSIGPYIAENYNHRGAAHLEMKRFDKAAADFNQACELGNSLGCTNYTKYFK